MEACKPIKTISPNDSFSSARERINENFKGLQSCLLYLQQQISLQQAPQQLIFPDEPVVNQSYGISYVNNAWIVTEASFGSSGIKYHLLSNETITVKDRTQHIVSGNMILDLGASLIIEPEGALIIL